MQGRRPEGLMLTGAKVPENKYSHSHQCQFTIDVPDGIFLNSKAAYLLHYEADDRI